MNIVITNGFEPNFSVGFVRGLIANGVDLLVVSCDETAPRLTAEGIANVNLRGSVSNMRSWWKRLMNLARYYSRLIALLIREFGATVHFVGTFRNEFILWEGIVMHSLIRLVSGHYIYTVHNVLPHSREGSRFFRAMYRWIYKLPGTLLVHTGRAARQLVEEFGVEAARIRRTSIGLNEEMADTEMSRTAARMRLGLGSEARVILFFGKIDEYKGLDILLGAFDALTVEQSRLVVAGEFRSEACRRRIRAQLDQLSRRCDVQIYEQFVPNDEAEIFFKAADVLCLPYRNIYQSGLVFLGPRFGVPMVVSDVGAMKEFVEGRFGIASSTNDCAGIKDALEQFFEFPERFSREQILDRAKELRWSSVCAELSPVYSRHTSRDATPASTSSTSGSVLPIERL